MNCYEIMHNITGEIRYIFGYSYVDACRKSKLELSEWTVLQCDYED